MSYYVSLPGVWKLLLLTSLLVSFNLSPVLGQKEKEKRDVQIIDFGADDERDGGKRRVNHGLILKTNPISFLFGHQTLEAEKELTDLISVQGGVGLTFAVQALGDVDLESLYGLGWEGIRTYCQSEQWVQDFCDDYDDYTYREQKTGIKFTFSPRLFFNNEGFEGSYISPAITYSRLRYQVLMADETFSQNPQYTGQDFQPEFEAYTDFTIRYGYSILFDKLTAEAFAGIGLRKRKAERQDLGRDITGAVRNGIRQIEDSNLRLEVGLRIGFQL